MKTVLFPALAAASLFLLSSSQSPVRAQANDQLVMPGEAAIYSGAGTVEQRDENKIIRIDTIDAKITVKWTCLLDRLELDPAAQQICKNLCLGGHKNHNECLTSDEACDLKCTEKHKVPKRTGKSFDPNSGGADKEPVKSIKDAVRELKDTIKAYSKDGQVDKELSWTSVATNALNIALKAGQVTVPAQNLAHWAEKCEYSTRKYGWKVYKFQITVTFDRSTTSKANGKTTGPVTDPQKSSGPYTVAEIWKPISGPLYQSAEANCACDEAEEEKKHPKIPTGPGSGESPNMEGTDGPDQSNLKMLTFPTKYGDLKTYLLDGAAGMATGAIILDPKGKTDAEKAANAEALQGCVISADGNQSKVRDGVAKFLVGAGATALAISVIDGHGANVCSTSVPVHPSAGSLPAPLSTPLSPGPAQKLLPSCLQTGHAAIAPGNYAGDISKINAMVGNANCPVIAANSKGVALIPPKGVFGPQTLSVSETVDTPVGPKVVKASSETICVETELVAPKVMKIGQVSNLRIIAHVGDIKSPVMLEMRNTTTTILQLIGGNTLRVKVYPMDVKRGVFIWDVQAFAKQIGAYLVTSSILPVNQ